MYSKYHYRYPLIQYRVQQGKAAIFALNDGVQALQQVLATSDWNVNWNGQKRHLQIEELRTKTHQLEVQKTAEAYKLYDWIALNQENYEEWQNCANLVQRIQLLERLLRNHLMVFCYGMDWKPTQKVEVSIQNIEEMYALDLYDARVLAFTIEFKTNLTLPPYVALRQSSSQGFGKTRPVWKRTLRDDFDLPATKELKVKNRMNDE